MKDRDVTPYAIYLDLIEGELCTALEDVDQLRTLEGEPKAAKIDSSS